MMKNGLVVKICFAFAIIVLAVLTALCLPFGASGGLDPAYADGPSDARARIGFKSDNFYLNEFYIEKNGGAVTARVYVSEVQSVAIPFTLTETRFGGGGSLFVFAGGYTLPAGSGYVDVTFNQIAGAESGSGVRLSDIYIHCDTATVTVGDVEYYGESELLDDDFLAVVYDKDGASELIMEGFPYIAYETDLSVSSRLIRSGSTGSETAVYYQIRDYDPQNTKELVFENYNSALVFPSGERARELKLLFVDNDRLNLREAYKLDITVTGAATRIFDLTQRRYLEEGERAFLTFAVMDDEPFSDRYVARAQYYQPGLTDPVFTMNEGGSAAIGIYFSALNGHLLPSFKLYYTVSGGSAIYGRDFEIRGQNYARDRNLGYIEINELEIRDGQYNAELVITGLDNLQIDGTRTVNIRFFVSGRSDILLQPLDTVRVDITDNEYPPSSDKVGWAFAVGGPVNGGGVFDEQDSKLTLFSQTGNTTFQIPVFCEYNGVYPVNIPVVVHNGTAVNNVDYTVDGALRRLFGNYYYVLDVTVQNFIFYGEKSFTVTIMEESLSDGLVLEGPAELNVIIQGDVEEGYNYIDYSTEEMNRRFDIGTDGALSFTLKRYETEEKTTYIGLVSVGTGGLTSEHIEPGTFPYAVNWAQGELKKEITIPFKPGWKTSALVTLKFQNHLGQEIFTLYKPEQKTSATLSLSLEHSLARYYFSTEGGTEAYASGFNILTFEYKYSSESLLRIAVKRDILNAYVSTSVKYRLTFDYRGMPPYLILGDDTAEIGRDIDSISGTINFPANSTQVYINISVPLAAGQKGIKYVNLELYEPSAGSYILDGIDGNPHGLTYSLAKIRINNDVYPYLGFESGTLETTDGVTEIRVLEYENKASDDFGVAMTFPSGLSTPRFYYTDVYLYSGYDLSLGGIEVYINGLKISAEPFSTSRFDGDSVLHTYSYRYSAGVYLNKNTRATIVLKYTGAGPGLEDTDILIEAEAGINPNTDFYEFLKLNTAPQSSEYSSYTSDIPSAPAEIFESDGDGFSFTVEKTEPEKDCHLYISLSGTAEYGTHYIIEYGGRIYEPAGGYILIPRGAAGVTVSVCPVDDYIKDTDKTAVVKLYIIRGGAEAEVSTLELLIRDDEYFGDFSVRKDGGGSITVSREGFTASRITLSYEIREITGVYGTDYTLKLDGQTDVEKTGEIVFLENDIEFSLTLYPLTEKGSACAFEFMISGTGESFRILESGARVVPGELSVSDGGFIMETASDFDLTPYSNYSSYIFDYRYYGQYTRGFTAVPLAYAKLRTNTEWFYMDFNPDGLSRIYAAETGAPSKYNVPSGIYPQVADINGDGRRELIFVVGLDTCFGGEEELQRLSAAGLTPGIYALDMLNGQYTRILAFYGEMKGFHHDIYIADLKNDGCPDIVVMSTPWNEVVLRTGGGNTLYIIDNAEGEFSISYMYSGAAAVVWTSEDTGGRYRPVVNIGIPERTGSGGKLYGRVLELSLGRNAAFLYFTSDKAETDEGGTFTVTVYNPTGRAGTARLCIESGDAVLGRDYTPSDFTVIFSEGEFFKTFDIKTYENKIPGSYLTLRLRLESSDFYSDGGSPSSLRVRDTSVIQRSVAYTVLESFNSNFTSSSFITGDKALFSILPLTIDGLKAWNNPLYDVRFSVTFGSHTFYDTDGDGCISAEGLRGLINWDDIQHIIYMKVEFLKKGTENVFYIKTFEAEYLYVSGDNSRDFINDVLITEVLYPGNMINIYAKQDVAPYFFRTTPGSFKLEYTSSVDNRTYTFYSDENGVVDAQIDLGDPLGDFTYSYKITSRTLNGPSYNSGNLTLRAPGSKMSYGISVIDSVRQSLLRNALVEVVGINVDYRFTGRTNAETGALVIDNIVPLKTYRITVNGDYGISYFASSEFAFVPSAEEPNLTLELALRTNDLSVDVVTVCVVSKYAADQIFGSDNLYKYLSGINVTLNDEERSRLQSFYISLFIRRNSIYYWEDSGHIAYYRIREDVLFASDVPAVYKSMTKNPDDLTIVFYRSSPEAGYGQIKFLLSGTVLTGQNSRFVSMVFDAALEIENPKPGVRGYWDYGPHNVCFYSFAGRENSIVDMVIESDMYLKGKKSIPLVSFGTGLGSFLLQPVQNMFDSVETATVPANFAFLNGMSFLLGFSGIDFAFDYDEENMSFSIYMGASKDLYESSHGMKYDKVDRPSLSQLRAARAAGLSTGRGQATMGVGLGGKMIFYYSDGEWTLLHGEIYFSVSASYNYTKYIILPVISIPAFFSATFSIDVQTTIYFDWNAAEEYTEVTGDLAIGIALEIECGIGIKGFLSASVYGRAGIEVIIQLESGATKLTLYVEGGVRIQILFWKYTYSFGRAEWSTQSDGYVDRDAALQSIHLSQLKNVSGYSGVAVLYSASGDMVMALGLGPDGQAEDVIIVTNVYEKSAPKIAELPDGTKLIAWINYDKARGENNEEVINYIYFDGESWSEVAAADDTITADLDMDLKVINGSFAIICTEVKEELLPGSTISERLIKSDVAVLVFDPETRTFAKTVLTNNLFNDRQALFDYEGGVGIAVVYRSENTNITDDMTVNDFLCGENADNKLYYSVYNAATNSWGAFSLFSYALPAVSTMSLKIVGGVAYIALECDNDDNFDTASDREIMLLQYIFATGQSRIARLTDNGVQDVSPSLMEFKDKVFMAYRSGDDVMYWYENESYYVCTLPQNYTNFEMFAGGEYAVMLFTMSVEGISQVFASVMDAESMAFSAPAQITFSDKPARDPILSFSVNGVSVYYCADTYTLISSDGEDYSFDVTSDIAMANLSLFGELSVSVLPADYSAMRPGEEFTFIVRIYNSGTVNVVNPWIKAYLGETLLGEFTADTVLGNNYLDVPVTVTLPSERSTLRFETGKDGLDENTDNNIAEAEVLLSDIAIDKNYTLAWNEDGTLTVGLSVTNEGTVGVGNITVSVTSYSNASSIYASTVILILAAGETKVITLTVAKENVRFNANNELWLKAYALTAGKNIYTVGADDYDTSDNVRGLRAARALFADGSTIALLAESLILTVGAGGYIGIVYIGDGEILVTSSDTSVLSVDGRNVTALKSGTATLTVTDGTETKTLNVTVNASETPEEPTDPEDPGEPTDPTQPVDPVPDPEPPVQWWVYAVSIAGAMLLAGAVIIIVLVKKGKIKIKK
jgi:hypothetical protein